MAAVARGDRPEGACLVLHLASISIPKPCVKVGFRIDFPHRDFPAEYARNDVANHASANANEGNSSAILPMIREGRTFTESLEVAGWVPMLAIDMIGIGERSGSLREMLDEVAVFYDAESEVRLEQLTTTLEPAILVVMGGIVVTILLAIYLPIIQSISGGAGVTGRH